MNSLQPAGRSTVNVLTCRFLAEWANFDTGHFLASHGMVPLCTLLVLKAAITLCCSTSINPLCDILRSEILVLRGLLRLLRLNLGGVLAVQHSIQGKYVLYGIDSLRAERRRSAWL